MEYLWVAVELYVAVGQTFTEATEDKCGCFMHRRTSAYGRKIIGQGGYAGAGTSDFGQHLRVMKVAKAGDLAVILIIFRRGWGDSVLFAQIIKSLIVPSILAN